MDKLEPLLKNRFWILLVPLLCMNLWGYFSANGALKAATKSRVETLDKVKSGIPAGSTDPNETYSAELQKRNDALEGFVNEELLDLWKKQQTRMVWPPRVTPNIPKVYLSEIKSNQVRFTYQQDYPEVMQRLHESVEPFVANNRGITWTPKVDFPVELIPRMKIGTLTIDSKQMWEAQEDIWVTQFILDAIRLMNKDADSVNSAVIRRVLAYQLLGGDGVPKGEGAAPGEGGGGGSVDPSVMVHGAAPSSYAPAMPGGGGGSNSSIAINPVEEFGIGGDPLAAGAGMNNMGSMAAPTGDPTAAPTGPAGPLRYVKDTPEAPYVERGFALSVIINQNKLVDFLVALSNSEWPVRVVRFHFGKNPFTVDLFTLAGATGGTGSNMGSSMMMQGGKGGFGSGSPGATPFTNPAYSSSGFTGPAGSGLTPGAPEVYPLDALQQPDLIQLDLLGVITMYRQPKEEIAALEAAAAGTTPAPDATSAEAPADPAAVTPADPALNGNRVRPRVHPADPAAVTPADPAAPAVGTPPAATPAAEAGSPGAAPATPATPGTPAPATGTPAPAAGTPAAPTSGTVPAPAAEAPAAAEATPPAEAPPKP